MKTNPRWLPLEEAFVAALWAKACMQHAMRRWAELPAGETDQDDETQPARLRQAVFPWAVADDAHVAQEIGARAFAAMALLTKARQNFLLLQQQLGEHPNERFRLAQLDAPLPAGYVNHIVGLFGL
jgi:hypothetical protein